MINNIRNSFKEYNGKVDINTYCKIAALYNKFLIDKAIEGKKVTLPSKMGYLDIVGRKQNIKIVEGEIKGLAPDWVKTKELWDKDPEAKEQKKRIFHLNSHTDGYIYKYIWSKKNVMVKNKTLYSLRVTRENKRRVNDLINKGGTFKTK